MPGSIDVVFLRIARKNGVLTAQECDELVTAQRALGEGDEWRSVAEIGLERGLLTEEQVGRIRRGERYMQVRAADRHLGEVCEMMGLVEREQVDDCLAQQKRAFQREGGDDLPRLGDLLQDRGFVGSDALLRATRVHEETRDPSRRMKRPSSEVLDAGVRPADSGRFIAEILAEFGIDRKRAEEEYRQEIEIYVDCPNCGRSNLRSSPICRRCETAL
jgi:hypothetical protein